MGYLNLFFISGFCITVQAQEMVPQSHFFGVENTVNANGIAVADYDRDGALDVFIVSSEAFDENDPQTWNRLYKNQRSGFSDVTAPSGLKDSQYDTAKELFEGIKMGASWGDYDNDGFPDLFLTNQGTDQLWHNKGNGTFEDVTEEASVGGPGSRYSSSALWWDYDKDGDLDLYVSSWLGDNALYRNDGGNNFTDVSDQTGLANASRTFTSIPFDVNKDGWIDIYLVNDFGPNFLYLNRSDGTFEDVTSLYRIGDKGNGMGVDICDFRNDGNFDIYLTNISQVVKNPFFVNNGSGFENLGGTLGIDDAKWGWSCKFMDLDHDMDEDLYVVNQQFFQVSAPEYNRFYEFRGDGFIDSSEKYGLNNLTDSRTQEVFDYDMDGDLDILLGNWGGSSILFNNQLKNLGNWIKIELQGTQSNRDAFGTVVRIKTSDTYQHRLKHGVNYLGQSITPLHFGLAFHEKIDELTIFWPSGKVEKVYDVLVNQSLKFKEGEQEEVFGEIYGTVGSVEVVTGFEQWSNSGVGHMKLEIFPHPLTSHSTSRLHLPRPGEIELKLLDALGRVLYEENFTAREEVMDLPLPEHLVSPGGIFFYHIVSGDNEIVKKVLKP